MTPTVSKDTVERVTLPDDDEPKTWRELAEAAILNMRHYADDELAHRRWVTVHALEERFNLLTAITALSTDKEEVTEAMWETFSDPSYYGMWCVREIGERRFGHAFHLVNGDEAQGLVRLLNAHAMRQAR